MRRESITPWSCSSAIIVSFDTAWNNSILSRDKMQAASRPGVSGRGRYPTPFLSTGTTIPAPWKHLATTFFSRSFIRAVRCSNDQPFVSAVDLRRFSSWDKLELLSFFSLSSINQLNINEYLLQVLQDYNNTATTSTLTLCNQPVPPRFSFSICCERQSFVTSRAGFYRPDALPVTEPTVSKHWRNN